MDSSSREGLLKLFEGITEWRRKLDSLQEEDTIRWSESHLSVVRTYILKLSNINSVFKLLQMYLPFGKDRLYLTRETVASFMQELQEFFAVPKLHHLYIKDNANALKKHELLAAFMDFLLQLLSHKTDFVHLYEDRIDHLREELRVLVTILGDTSLIGDDCEEVKNLLAEFESVANEAGSFVHSFIFGMDELFMITRMDNALAALLRYIYYLRENINNLSFLLPCISKINITAKTATVDSHFIVECLLCDLEDLMHRKYDLIVDVKAHIKVLHQQLMLSQSFLKDLDIKELRGPVMQIRDLACEAEYLVSSFLVGDIPHDYLTVRLPDIIHKIKFVGNKLQEIKKNYDIGALKVAKDLNAQLSLQAKRNFEVDDSPIGLEDEATRMLDHLLGGAEHLQVITIFGMPGLGKTTLAKKLHNHPSVSYHFDRCSWCVVSQTYQRKNLLTSILNSLGSELDKFKILDMEEESLGEHIHKSLKGRRYLIIMDDVWDSNACDDFGRYFPDDGNGSRILFTSRNKDVAPPNSTIYALPSLSNDQCWELLQKKVFHDEPCPPQLQQIGKKIAENCHGLPLAVVVVAGVLSTTEKEESAWKNVGGSLASYVVSDQNNSTMQILKLSYEHLPDHLKLCFLYFGSFPGREIHVKKLKCLWIAERFINKEERLENAESLADEYLTELIDRSLVMVAKRRSDGGAKACIVHDLLRDLCLRIAEEENFLTLIEGNCSIYTRHHRLHVGPNSFPPFGVQVCSVFGYSPDSGFEFLNMKLLKILDLPYNELNVGDGIKHLFHLRYLAIKYMPISIGNLVNLEYLVVTLAGESLDDRVSYSSIYISSVIQKLVKLKYLSVPIAYFDKNSSRNKPTNLEFLSNVVIDKLEDEEMLKCLPHLCKLKCNLRSSRYLDLTFLTQLKSLNVGNFSWGASMEINFPSNIKKLTLNNSRLTWESMSIIGGLPKLEVLKLWDTRDGEFKQLRFLKLTSVFIGQWNVASHQHFPRLQRLVVHECFFLREIPCEIGEIATLQLIEVNSSQKSVRKSAIRIQDEQREMGNEKLSVIIKQYESILDW